MGAVLAPGSKQLSFPSHPFGQDLHLAKKATTLSGPVSLPPSRRTSGHGSSMEGSLAQVWREVQGCYDWEGLVSPLHPLLREELVRYGELLTACYKGFDLDPSSNRYLNCKYGKRTMFKQLGMEEFGYEVTKYIYATAPDVMTSIPIQQVATTSACRGRWVGYVAVASDATAKKLGRRDILVTFRGTVTNQEWVANLMSSLTPARLDPTDPRPDVQVESGFLSLYTSNETSNKFGLESCREQLLSEVSRLLNKYKGEELSISLAGHSMGSSLAHLLAYDISELGLNKVNPSNKHSHHHQVVPVTVFSYGGPRVGNVGFKTRCEELGVKVLRIANVNDPVTKLPGVFLNEGFRVWGKHEMPWSCTCYSHVGVEVVLDFFNMKNPSLVHDLEAYISSLNDHNQNDVNIRDLVIRNIMNNVVENFEMSRLRKAASGLANFFGKVSDRAEFLTDDNFLGWMNCMALFMFL
ncbi:Galactolipase DONGLE, chloroplastic [Linum perenne]